MELEVRELAAAVRTKYQTRVQSYSAELNRLENDFKTAKNTYQKARQELLGEMTSNEDLSDQKQRLIDNSEKLERSSKRLEVGYRVAVETEEIGSRIMTDLNQQKETIQRTRSRVNTNHSVISLLTNLIAIVYPLAARNWRWTRTQRQST